MAANGLNPNFNNNQTLTLVNKWMESNCVNIYSSNSPFYAYMLERNQIGRAHV